MIPVYDQAQVLAQVYAEVEPRFTALGDLAHGWEHVSRVYQLALTIAEHEGADRFIVGMAALLHDLGHTVPDNADQHHVDLSVTLATPLLARYQVPAEQQEAILHSIVAHSFSRGAEPRTLEACVVRDADRLDGLGAIGIMRWAITGGQRSTPQARCYHPDDPFAQQHTLDDHTYMLDHFYKKLLKIGDSMATTTGSRLAEQRTAFMHAYLQQFKQELLL